MRQNLVDPVALNFLDVCKLLKFHFVSTTEGLWHCCFKNPSIVGSTFMTKYFIFFIVNSFRGHLHTIDQDNFAGPGATLAQFSY